MPGDFTRNRSIILDLVVFQKRGGVKYKKRFCGVSEKYVS